VNLRQGGTTHPYMALCALTTGRLDPASGRFLTPTGEALHYQATDNLCDERLRGLENSTSSGRSRRAPGDAQNGVRWRSRSRP
jgi:hypothetical protein